MVAKIRVFVTRDIDPNEHDEATLAAAIAAFQSEVNTFLASIPVANVFDVFNSVQGVDRKVLHHVVVVYQE